jgi:hypothetical protein
LSKRSLFNLSGSLCLLALLLVPYTISGCTVSETSSVSQEETVDVPNEAAQPKVDTTQLLADLGTLSNDSFEGRKTGTVGNQRARDYIVQAFEKHGLQPFDSSFIQPFSFFSKEDNKEHRGANVVGYIEGASNPERYIVITAHYDHLGVINGQIYNGADDNASGTAALFAVADYFSKHRPDNSVILVATDGEELGEEGSKAFVARPPVGRHAIVVNVNLDMIAHDDQNKLYVAGTYQYPFLKPYVEEASKDGRVELVFGLDRPYPREQDWTYRSDNASFHAANIPFLYFLVGEHKDYHRPTDDFETIDQNFYVGAVEVAVDVVRGLDQNLPTIAAQQREHVSTQRS